MLESPGALPGHLHHGQGLPVPGHLGREEGGAAGWQAGQAGGEEGGDQAQATCPQKH